MQKYQIMFEARNQQILYNKDTEIFYYKDLGSGDILDIPPVLQQFLILAFQNL